MSDNSLDVRVGANTGALDAGMQRAPSIVERAVAAIRGQFARLRADTADAMKGARAEVEDSVRGMSGSLGGLTGVMGAVRGAIAGAFAGLSIGQAVGVMKSFEDLEIRLRSVMGSAEAGDKAFAWIKQFAKDTPFEVDQVTKSFMLLKNLGLDPMDGTLQALSDQAAKAGTGAEGLERIALALGQAFTKTKLQTDEVNQLLEAGVPAWDLLAKATGKETKELQDLAGKGQLGRDVIKALIEEIGRSAAGGAGAAMASLSGQVSNFSDNLKNGLDDVRKYGGGLEGIKEAIGTVNAKWSELADSGQLREWATDAGQAFTAVIQSAVSMTTMIGKSVAELVGWVGSGFRAILDAITSTFGGQSIRTVELFVNALKVVEIGVLGLRTSFQIAKEFVAGAIEAMVGYVLRFADAASRALQLDFAGAAAAWNRGGQAIEGAVRERMGNVVKIAEDANAKMQEIALRPLASVKAPAAAAAGGAASGPRRAVKFEDGDDDKKKGKKAKADPSQMPKFEGELEAQRLAATERDALHGMSKQAEQAFWDHILATAKLSEADKLAVGKRASQARVQVLQQEAREADQVGQSGLAAWQERGLAQVELDAEGARNRLALGQITQAQLLAQEEQFEQRRFEIKRTALEAELAAKNPDRDPVQVAQIHAQLEQLEQQHQLRLAQVRGQIAVQSSTQMAAIWTDLSDRVGGLWDKGVQAMMNGTLTWRGALRAVGTELVGWFAGVAKTMVTQWVVGEQAKTGATAAGTASRWAMESLAAAKSVALWAATAVKNIMTSAWEAMAGAWKAIVGIPYVGPVLAPIAAGAAFAGVAAIAGNVASAEGGYDIPAGVNPMTQLHEREMVLPAKQADVIRDLADGGGGARGGDTHVHVHAIDARSVQRLFMDNGPALADALRRQQRNFNQG